MCSELNKLTHTIAAKLHCELCGIIDCKPLTQEFTHYQQWLQKGRNAQMGYLERNLDKRENPALLVEGAQSLIVTLHSYNTLEHSTKGINVAQYARFRDYHTTIKEFQRELLRELSQHCDVTGSRGFVDSAPVMERSLAVKAGLGWIGRNSMLINREYGNKTFIGVIFCTAHIEPDSVIPVKDGCGNCTLCQESCPTGAIHSDRTIDANRCLAYHTIESHSDFPEEYLPMLKETFYGCDKCMDACIWNRRAKQIKNPNFTPEKDFFEFNVDKFLAIEKKDFKRLYGSNPLFRNDIERTKGILKNLIQGVKEKKW